MKPTKNWLWSTEVSSCWAHAPSKFEEALQVDRDNASTVPSLIQKNGTPWSVNAGSKI